MKKRKKKKEKITPASKRANICLKPNQSEHKKHSTIVGLKRLLNIASSRDNLKLDTQNGQYVSRSTVWQSGIWKIHLWNPG